MKSLQQSRLREKWESSSQLQNIIQERHELVDPSLNIKTPSSSMTSVLEASPVAIETVIIAKMDTGSVFSRTLTRAVPPVDRKGAEAHLISPTTMSRQGLEETKIAVTPVQS